MVTNNKGELKMKRITGMILVMVMLLSLTVGYAQSPTVTPEIKPPIVTKLNTKVTKENPTVLYADIMMSELGKTKKDVLAKLELKTEVAFTEQDSTQIDPNFKEIRLLDKDKKYLGKLIFKGDKLVMVSALDNFKDKPASKASNTSRLALQQDWSYSKFDLLEVPGAVNTIDQSDTTIIDEITFTGEKGIIVHVMFMDYLDKELDEGITTLEANVYLNKEIFDTIPKG